MHIAFLGLGQIGGSAARAALAAGFATRVVAWTPSGTGPGLARSDGIVAAGSAGEAIRGADLVVLAAPPLVCLALLDELAGPLAAARGGDAVITDVASTKAAIVTRARELGLRFVGGHPMAGRETAGYAASDPDLFVGRPWVIVPSEPADAAADDRVVGFAEACGARPVVLDAAAHDDAVATVSHVPLVVSAALVEAVADRPDRDRLTGLAAGGWASMTRLAGGDPAMGAGIVATNSAAIAARLRAVDAVIHDWLDVLAAVGLGEIDPATIERRLARARTVALGNEARDGAGGRSGG